MVVTKAVFTKGSMLRHVVFMTSTSATSLLSIFLIEVLTVVYIAMLRDDSLLAAFAVAKTLMFFLISMILGIAVAVSTTVSRSLGSGVPDQARRLASSGVLLGSMAAICGAALELVVLDQAIRMLGGEGNSFTAAREYLWLTLPASVLVAVEQLCVTACNRNGLDLQSSRFSTGIDCVYPAPRTSIDCKRTCIQPLRPAIERNRPGLNATEKPMIYRPSDSGLQELG